MGKAEVSNSIFKVAPLANLREFWPTNASGNETSVVPPVVVIEMLFPISSSIADLSKGKYTRHSSLGLAIVVVD